MTIISEASKHRGAVYQSRVADWVRRICKLHDKELCAFQEVRSPATKSRYDFVVYNRVTDMHYVIESKTRTYVDSVLQLEKYYKTIPLVFKKPCFILVTRKYELGKMFDFNSMVLSQAPELSIENLLLCKDNPVNSHHLIIDKKFSRKKGGA